MINDQINFVYKNLYLDTSNGSDDNDGSENSPFKSLQEMYNVIKSQGQEQQFNFVVYLENLNNQIIVWTGEPCVPINNLLFGTPA
tara:strand:- start:253 stop:507 length:255 start_codon:yes stop_codon:yes gene_type:complete